MLKSSFLIQMLGEHHSTNTVLVSPLASRTAFIHYLPRRVFFVTSFSRSLCGPEPGTVWHARRGRILRPRRRYKSRGVENPGGKVSWTLYRRKSLGSCPAYSTVTMTANNKAVKG